MEQTKSTNDVAIIGFALKFPGEANSPESFWEMLLQGKSALTDVPKERYNIETHFSLDENRSGKLHARGGNFIQEDISGFDASFFSINPTEAKCMDPQQRMLLETTYQGIENAGLSLEDIRGTNTAVYVGSFTHDYEVMNLKDPELPNKYRMSGTSAAMLANRISWFFDLQGPSIALDTACSSSLTALHLACQSIRTGESTMAIVAGSNLMFSPETSIALADMNFLSPDSTCYSFDYRANGYVRGEGIGIIIIKAVSEAVKDVNTIRAVIRASGANQDGKTPGITQPNSEAQEALIKRTYKQAGLEMGRTRYFEAHGTGTSLGDPAETRAIANCFGESRNPEEPLYIGAVKTSIGHLEGASGIAGVIKTVMILENGIIPPNLNFEKPNPKILVDRWNVKFPSEATRWPGEGLRRASINSFGFGGSNVHVVLDDALNYFEHSNGQKSLLLPSRLYPQVSNFPAALEMSDHINGVNMSPRNTNGNSTHKLLVWSSSDEDGVNRLINSFESALSKDRHPSRIFKISDMAYTLAEKRTKLPWKSYLVINEASPTWETMSTDCSKAVKSIKSPSIGFVFTGQGAQWFAMGRELMIYDVFRINIEGADKYLRDLGSSWSLIDELINRDESSCQLDSPELGQPATTILQVALVELLADWGISPTVVVGHSSGEVAAAYCVGAISKESAWKIAYFRGFATASVSGSSEERGAMLSVGLSCTEVEKYLRDTNSNVQIGCNNSPRNVTLSGRSADINALKTLFDEQGIFCRKLKVNVAYHSKYMEAVASVYRPLICDLEPGTSKGCAMISSVTSKRVPLHELSQADYWVRNLVSTVKFSEALTQTCIKAPKFQLGRNPARHMSVSFLLEIGPHAALQGPIRDILSSAGRSKDIQYGSVLVRGRSAQSTILEAVGKLHSHGCSINISKANEPDARALQNLRMMVDLPSFSFNHKTKYWLEGRISKNYRFGKTNHHELLGTPVLDWNSLEARWQNRLVLSETSWMKDHVINGAVLYPAAGMLVMAIEAARQLSPPDKIISAYRLKDTSISKRLTIPSDNEGIEVQVYFRPSHDVTGKSQVQAWNEFRICSYEDGEWMENCRGAISLEYHSEPESSGIGIGTGRLEEESNRFRKEYEKDALSSKTPMDPRKMYQYLHKFGFEYGPSFTPIQHLSFNEATSSATADINVSDWKSKVIDNRVQPHVIHPTTLDGILQLIFPAVTKGCKVSTPMVPTLIKNLWISNIDASPDNLISACMKGEKRGYRGVRGTFRAVHASTKNPCIAGEFEMTYLSNETGLQRGSSDLPKFYNLDWKPDTRLLEDNVLGEMISGASEPIANGKRMLGAKESLCHMTISRTLRKLGENKVLQPHLLRYVEWMKHELVCGPTGQLSHYNDTDFQELLAEVEQCDVEGAVLVLVARNLERVLSGDQDPLELLFGNGLLQSYYRYAHDAPAIFQKVAKYIDLLAHKSPDIKILEIGAGTGSATNYALDVLMHHSAEHELGAPRFAEYVFTDISPGFFENAKDQFKNDRLKFKILDIEKDPQLQGFETGAYDLIIAANVLHATSDIENTLRNVHRLLRPGGKLILFEITNLNILRCTFIFGLLSGWWMSNEQYRTFGPLMEVSKWDKNLKKTGFSGVDMSFSNDETVERQVCRAMVSTATRSSSNSVIDAPLYKEQIIIISESQSNLSLELQAAITPMAFQCIEISVDEVPKCDLTNAFCVFLTRPSSSWLQDMDESRFNILRKLTSEPTGLLWVWSKSPDQCSDQEMVLGFARSIRSEQEAFKFITLGFEDTSQSAPVSPATNIVHVLRQSFSEPTSGLESEYLVKNGVVCIGRIVEANYLTNYIQKSREGVSELQLLRQIDRPLMMTVGTVGLLDTIQFVDDDKSMRPMCADEVEIEVKAVGINFRDILTALGQLPDPYLGSECAGIVTRVGDSVKDKFEVGDRVACAMKGSYRTYGRCRASCAVKLPEKMDYASGASIIVAFATAYYSLVNVAHLRKGESILIHAGAGGFGQAVIQLSKLLGAEIYVTVSTEAKKNLLIDLYDIPEDHFFSSRSLAFKDGIMRMTNGRGVDVVVNSLSGEALRCSWECVATLGRFVEVGKRDILSSSISALGGLPMQPFAKNTTFSCVDITVVLRTSPALAEELLRAIMDLAEAEKIFPPKPLQVFDASKIEEIFRSMQSGKHTGKFVVSFGDDSLVRVTPPTRFNEILTPQATYVIAGGLGGVGRSIARWMVDQNARHLVLLSRKTVHSKETTAFLQELRMKGAKVLTPSCDITDKTALENTLKKCAETMPPVRGCIQASMVLKSAMFAKMSWEDFDASVRPKVRGSWNLHSILPTGLDFFVMLSSYAGIVGSLGQSNYAAGNTYQDGLARYRALIGEKAISIDLGPIKDVGFVAEHQNIEEFLQAGGHQALSERDLHNILEYYCNPGLDASSELKSQIITGLPLPATLRAKNLEESSWLARPLFRQLHQIESTEDPFKGQSSLSSTSLETLLHAATSISEAGNMVADALGTKLSNLLAIDRQEVDIDKTIYSYGVDSLVAIELRNWFVKMVAADIAVFDILGNHSIHSIGALAAERSELISSSVVKGSITV